MAMHCPNAVYSAEIDQFSTRAYSKRSESDHKWDMNRKQSEKSLVKFWVFSILLVSLDVPVLLALSRAFNNVGRKDTNVCKRMIDKLER